jgi:hypothetical protein
VVVVVVVAVVVVVVVVKRRENVNSDGTHFVYVTNEFLASSRFLTEFSLLEVVANLHATLYVGA